MNNIVLRPYQEKFIADINDRFNGVFNKVVGVAPCGSGKTIMAAYIIKQYLDSNLTSLFFVHRHELIDQTSKVLNQFGIEHGIIESGTKVDNNLRVQVASIQTLYRRLHKVSQPNLLICDECHHILAKSYKKIIDYWDSSKLLGLTATPQRAGGINLGDVFESMVLGPSVKNLIEAGSLTRFRYYAPNELDLSDVRIVCGDYDNSEIEDIMSSNSIVGDIVENYMKFADGKSAICYCVNVKHSMLVTEAFLKAGIQAAHCDGSTPKNIREFVVDNFRQGVVKVLCNAELFGEGFDVPNMDAVILARPTRSLTLFIQQSMRALRPDPDNPDKVAIIIDHVQNYIRFGLPDDNRHWSLTNFPNKSADDTPKLKTCPSCRSVCPIATKICPYCGFSFASQSESGIGVDQKEGTLVEVYSSEGLESSPNLTIEDYIKIAKAKNYKLSWAAYQALENAKSLDDCRHIAEVMGYKQGWAWYKWQDIQQSSAFMKSLFM